MNTCKDMNDTIKWFIAGSKALQDERDLCRVIFGKMQNKWEKPCIVKTFEDFQTSLTKDNIGRQADYNNFIRNEADGIIFIFDDYVGGITMDEFDIAYNSFKENNRPQIHVYCRKADNISNPDIEQLKARMNSLHQYYCEYNDKKELQTIISNDIDRYIIEANNRNKNNVVSLSEDSSNNTILFAGTVTIPIILLLSFAYCCWLSAKSITMLIPTFPFVINLFITASFFIMMIIGEVNLLKGIFRKQHSKYSPKLIISSISFYIIWAILLIPTCTHSLFYNKNLIDIVQNDIRLTKSYLSLINESPCKFSDKIKHEINEMVKLEKALILLKYDNKNVQDNHIKTIDSTLLVSYKTIKLHAQNIHFNNEYDEYTYMSDNPQTAHQKLQNMINVWIHYFFTAENHYNVSGWIFLSIILSLIPCICLFLLKLYYPMNRLKKME